MCPSNAKPVVATTQDRLAIEFVTESLEAWEAKDFLEAYLSGPVSVEDWPEWADFLDAKARKEVEAA